MINLLLIPTGKSPFTKHQYDKLLDVKQLYLLYDFFSHSLIIFTLYRRVNLQFKYFIIYIFFGNFYFRFQLFWNSKNLKYPNILSLDLKYTIFQKLSQILPNLNNMAFFKFSTTSNKKKILFDRLIDFISMHMDKSTDT